MVEDTDLSEGGGGNNNNNNNNNMNNILNKVDLDLDTVPVFNYKLN